MKLPEEFLSIMKKNMKGSEYCEFVKSFDINSFCGLRINTLKTSVNKLKNKIDYLRDSVLWSDDGYYYDCNYKPGKESLYHCGVFYIQEPSAMLPGKLLEAKPGEKVLDLCAAPGGKTIKIASDMKNEGLLVANDINFKRTKALVKNIELYGVENAVVTNEKPENLAKNLPEYFDRVLVDAPCSGEGMFRKSPKEINSWMKYKKGYFPKIQKELLEQSYKMLKFGGRIVYSTCTFNSEENEKVIYEFLENYENCKLISFDNKNVSNGRSEWAFNFKEIEKAYRIWPHINNGEGHFAAVIIKGNPIKENNKTANIIEGANNIEIFNEFCKNNLKCSINGNIINKDNLVYIEPSGVDELKNINILKSGLFLGKIKNDKFIPSHPFILTLKKEDLKRIEVFDGNSIEAMKYLKGETLIINGEKGYTGIIIDGYTCGWANQMGNMLKNKYPKGWRMF